MKRELTVETELESLEEWSSTGDQGNHRNGQPPKVLPVSNYDYPSTGLNLTYPDIEIPQGVKNVTLEVIAQGPGGGASSWWNSGKKTYSVQR